MKRVMKKLSLIVLPALLFLYSCGSADTGKESETYTPPKASLSGEDIYKSTCAACHQGNGEGVAGAFPPLAKSDYLVDKEAAIKQVLKGSSGELVVNGKTYNNTMPPQALSDVEAAAVLTYVYSSLGNNACTITPAEVKAVRDKL